MISDEEADASGLVRVLVELEPDSEVDREHVERLTRQVRVELAELDVESVDFAAGGMAPEGTKTADPVTVGAIVVALSASGGVFTSVIDTLRDWLGRSTRLHRIAVTIDGDTIELERATARQQRELVEAFIRRHSGGG
jgi:hypothetical protein